MTFTYLHIFLLGVGGATALELLKLYDYRGKLTQKKYQNMIRSVFFWAVVLGMLLASGFVTWAFYANYDKNCLEIWNIVITGMVARSVIREIVSAQISNSKTTLGGETTLKDIFM